MKCRTGWIVLLLLLICQPSLAVNGLPDAEESIDGIAEAGQSLLPPTAYSESPFEQGATTNRIGEILGSKTGYIHPYLALGEYYTDNLFNRESDEESDFYTRITPGIWVSLPASRYPLRQVSTLNTAPGGLSLSRFRSTGTTRLQAYAGYQADILEHNDFSSEDEVNHKAEGYFRYSLRGGLALELLDIFEDNQDTYNTGISRDKDDFKSNLFSALLSYDISPKTYLQLEYGHYSLSYDSDRNAFRDRDDDSIALRGFYRFLPKTSVFLEYNFISIDYDEEEQSDSDEHRAYLGFQWEQSGKSRWRLMGGVGEKDFDDSSIDDATNFLAEIQFLHRFTPKTYVQLRGTRATNETDSPDSEYTIANKIQLVYYQRFRARFLGSVNLYFENIDYKGDSALADREDDKFYAGFDLKYTLKNWLALSGGYSFVTRDSNFPGSDYDTNTVYLNLIFSL